MRTLLTIISIFFSVIAFGAEKQEAQKAAIVMENYSKDFDFIFFAKIVLVFILAIVAAISYAQYVKQERES